MPKVLGGRKPHSTVRHLPVRVYVSTDTMILVLSLVFEYSSLTQSVGE